MTFLLLFLYVNNVNIYTHISIYVYIYITSEVLLTQESWGWTKFSPIGWWSFSTATHVVPFVKKVRVIDYDIYIHRWEEIEKMTYIYIHIMFLKTQVLNGFRSSKWLSPARSACSGAATLILHARSQISPNCGNFSSDFVGRVYKKDVAPNHDIFWVCWGIQDYTSI